MISKEKPRYRRRNYSLTMSANPYIDRFLQRERELNHSRESLRVGRAAFKSIYSSVHTVFSYVSATTTERFQHASHIPQSEQPTHINYSNYGLVVENTSLMLCSIFSEIVALRNQIDTLERLIESPNQVSDSVSGKVADREIASIEMMTSTSGKIISSLIQSDKEQEITAPSTSQVANVPSAVFVPIKIGGRVRIIKYERGKN